MSTHSMLLRCNDCDEEFYMDMEWFGKDSLIKKAEETKCPKCGSENWSMTDSCER